MPVAYAPSIRWRGVVDGTGRNGDNDMRDMGAESRWWPADPALRNASRPLMRAVDLCYAVLGPVVTHHLVAALDAVPAAALTRVADDVRSELKRCDGRSPSMLPLLAAAMVCVAQHQAPLADDDASGGPFSEYVAVFRRLPITSDSFKLLGWLTVEAVQQFGWDRQTFLEYCGAEWDSVESAWPPAGAAYTQRPPELPAPLSDEPEMVDDNGNSDPFGIWQELNSRRPTLIGAHLARLPELERFMEMLDRGLAYADEDLNRVEDRPREAQKLGELRAAVQQVHEAAQLIKQAQARILRVFPT